MIYDFSPVETKALTSGPRVILGETEETNTAENVPVKTLDTGSLESRVDWDTSDTRTVGYKEYWDRDTEKGDSELTVVTRRGNKNYSYHGKV